MRKRTFSVGVVILAAFLWAFEAASGGNKKGEFSWEEVGESDWRVAQDSARGIFDAAMIFEKIEADDRKMGDDECYYILYRRVRILNEIGRKYGDVEIPFLSPSQDVKDIRGRTVMPDGTVIELEKGHIFKKEVIRGEDIKFEQYSFSLPGVSNDCLIEYMIKYRTKYNYHNTWIIQKDIPLLKGEYRWKFYTGEKGPILAMLMAAIGLRTPNFLWLNCGANKSYKQLPTIKEPTETLFEIWDVPPFEEEPYMVPGSSVKAKLICYYGPEGAAASFWGDRASEIRREAKAFCEKDKKIRSIVGSFDGLETEEQKIKAAYEWIQGNILNTAYDDVLDKKGRKEEPEDNESVNDVIRHGYGDREDINRVFYDMLREMNIDAKMAYTMDRSEDLFIYDAKYWQFDASLVAVPDGGNGFVYYIPGYKYAEPGTVPWFFEGSNVLVGGADVDIISIPVTGAKFNNTDRICNLVINEDYEISGTVDSRFTGHDARGTRMYLEDNDSTEYESLLQERFEEQFQNARLDSFQIKNLDNSEEPLELTWNVEYPDIETRSDRILLDPFDYFSNADNPFFAQERKRGVLFEYSYRLRESAQIELPEGWIIEALPRDTVYANVAGECGVQFTNFGNMLNVQRHFTLNSPFWRVDQYPVIKALFQTREDISDLIIVLTKEE